MNDMGRRVAMMKLAIDESISIHDAATYLSVGPRTISVYHRPSVKAKQAAEILAHPDGSFVRVPNDEEMGAGDPNPEEMEMDPVPFIPTHSAASCHSPFKPPSKCKKR